MYTAKQDKLEQLHRDMLTNNALAQLSLALARLVADAARTNTRNEVQHTEIHLTADEAANALRVIQQILKPLPEGTMTA